MEKIICPFCNEDRKKEVLKSWKYGEINVTRYHCKCKNVFNYYQSPKSSWTIPKSRDKK